MTYEEVIKDITENGLNLGAGDYVSVKALKIAIKALEKQIPKKPDYEGDGYDDNGNIDYDTWICPNCNHYFELDYEKYEYCPECGKAIDWRVEIE